MSKRVYLIGVFIHLELLALVWTDILKVEKVCDDKNAIILKCYDKRLNQIPSDGTIYRHEKMLIKVDQKPGACAFQIPEFVLLFVPPKDDSFEDIDFNHAILFEEHEYELEPYSIKNAGKTILTVLPVDIDQEKKVANSAKCEFNVGYAKPVVTLEGGAEEYFTANEEATIECRARNINFEDGSQKNLTFEWKCSIRKGSSSSFCTSMEMQKNKGKTKLVVPASAAKVENVFEITVDVGLSNIPDRVSSTSKLVFFSREPGSHLEIECIKNCKEASLTLLPVILRAVCIKCGLQGDAYLLWTIKDSQEKESIDYSRLKSRKGYEFYLQPDSLKVDEDYMVTVKVAEPTGMGLAAQIKLHTDLPPVVKDCKIDPPEGVAFETGFQIKCLYFAKDVTFSVFAVTDGIPKLMTKTKSIEDASFMLPANSKVQLNATNEETGYTQSINIDVKVKECLELSGSKAKIINAVSDKLDEVMELVENGHSDLALQGVSAIVAEYNKLPQDVTEDLDKKIVDTVVKVKLKDSQTAQQMAEILAQVTGKYTESNPDISGLSTEICADASKILMDDAKYAEKPEIMRPRVDSLLKTIAACSQAGLNKNQKAVEPLSPLVSVPTTEFPMLANEISEYYPDYADDEISSENMAKFDKAAENMKKICFSNAKMLAYTMVPEEDPAVTKKKLLTIVAARVYCHEKNSRIVGTAEVSVQISEECSRQKVPIVDVLTCYTSKNPYWYIDNISLVTPVVFVKFSGNKAQRSAMQLDLVGEEPFKIILATNESTGTKLEVHQAPLPDKSISELAENIFYDKICIHRISVFKDRGFTIQFPKMTDSDSYDVTVTHFEKPSYRYFESNYRTISVNKSIIDMTGTRPYDSFWYLSLLPNKKMIHRNGGDFLFSVFTTGCYLWNATSKHWEFACKAEAGYYPSKNITCLCKNGLSFTGCVLNNELSLVKDLKLTFELEMQFCWIIYVTFLVTFFLFSTFLFFTSFETPDDILDRVFFVGDVPSWNQFAYIVIIQTGNKTSSGTTSNITIQLRGSEGDSLEHVLNYPDPDLVMLQKDTKTWFVIATGQLLGDLKEIKIWFDSIGHNTKWFCSTIEVYDVQSNNFWQFQMDDWFDVLRQDHNTFTLKPSKKRQADPKEKKTSKRVLKAVRSFMGKMLKEVNLWNLLVADPLLTRKERLSIIFSSLLLMYCVTMFTYSVPSFDESDSIDENTFGFHWKLIWIPVLSSFVAFLIHFPLVYFIKRGKLSVLRRKGVPRITRIMSIIVLPLCWVTVVSVSLICTTLLIIYGFWIPADTSLLWLVSSVLSIFFNIMVLQSISSVIYGYFLKLPSHVESFEKTLERVIRYVELQRAWIYKRFGSLSLRPYLRHLYNNLDYVTIRERYKWEETKLKIKEILEDLVMISLYVALLYLVLMLDKEPHAYHNHTQVENLVSGKSLGKKIRVKSIADIEKFTSQILLPSIQSVRWYGKFIQENPGMTKDFSNSYLGIIRLRQHRTKEIKCRHPELLRFLNMTCRPEFSTLKETGNFSRRWVPEKSNPSVIKERMDNAWKYTDSSVTGASRYFGEFGYYPGGGYVLPLGRNLKNSLVNLQYMKRHKWLDLRTRALFIEFLTYNPNINLFNSVSVVFEINSAGQVVRHIEIQTRKFLMVNRDKVFTRRVVFISFAVVNVALILRVMYKLIKKRISYFYDIWSIFDIFIVILTGTSIYMYFGRLKHIQNYISVISESDNNEFVKYFHLFAADNTLTALTATLVFVATLRLWKLLRFMIIVKIIEKTLKDAWKSLLVCLTFHLISMISFAVVSVLLFSNLSQDFRSLKSACVTLLLLCLSLKEDYDSIQLSFMSIPFYTVFMIFSIFFLTVYIAIISLYFSDARDYYADEPSYVQKYLKENWNYYKSQLTVRGKKLRGGEDIAYEDLVIKPKSGERYENCMTIAKSRLDGMALVTMAVLRNLEGGKISTEEDFQLISNIIKTLFGKESSEKEIFFVSGDSHHIKFVDDRRIKQIADLCERVVRKCKNIQPVSRKLEKSLIDERIDKINVLIDNVVAINGVLDRIHINVR